jgi:hypothetical protein
MYNQAIKIFYRQVENLGEKIILAINRERVKQELRAPTYYDLYSRPDKYKGKIFF